MAQHGFTAAQTQAFKEQFDAVDTDLNAHINHAELKAVSEAVRR